MSNGNPHLIGERIPSAGDVLVPADVNVNLEGVVQSLIEYAVHLGYLHWLLFGVPLVITSAKDGHHAPNSLHDVGRALDFRTLDKDEAAQVLFLNLLAWSAVARRCTVFDERGQASAAHIHVEYHGA